MSFNLDTNLYEGFIYKIVNDINDKIYIGQTTLSIKERWHGHMSAALSENRYKSALYSAMRKYGRSMFHIIEVEKICCDSLDDLINELNTKEEEYIHIFKSLTSQCGYNCEKGGNNKRVPGRVVNKYDINLNFICQYDSCEEAGRQNNIDGCTIYGCCKHYYYTANGFVWAFNGEEPIRPPYLDREKPKKKKYKTPSKAMDSALKYKRRLERLNWNKQRIFVYNSFGDVVDIYDDIIQASIGLNIKHAELIKNLEGTNLCYKKYVLRYECDPFDKYPRSVFLQPISVYNIQGKLIQNFETIKDAENFIGCQEGEITKTIKRGGSCCGFLLSKYGEQLVRKIDSLEHKILMCDDNNNVIREYKTKKSVADYFGVTDLHHELDFAIKNNIKYRGYYWKYLEEFPVLI
jgi:group I intron endonuclease